KLAAMEAHFETSAPADLVIGGLPNEQEERVNYAIHLPGFLSYVAYGDLNAVVKGLKDFPRENWPPILITHLAFQVMVGIGVLLLLVSLLYLFFRWKKQENIYKKWFLTLLAVCTPLGFIALEAGWTVTEVGRQPWIIYGIMKTADAVSPMPGLRYSLLPITLVYLVLTFVVVRLMSRQIKALKN